MDKGIMNVTPTARSTFSVATHSRRDKNPHAASYCSAIVGTKLDMGVRSSVL